MNQWSRRLAYLVFLLSGIAALIYEISWSRQLGLLFGHTVHAASVVLGSYFAGMAVGYSIGGHLSKRVRPLVCLLYTSPSPRDKRQSRMPSSA